MLFHPSQTGIGCLFSVPVPADSYIFYSEYSPKQGLEPHVCTLTGLGNVKVLMLRHAASTGNGGAQPARKLCSAPQCWEWLRDHPHPARVGPLKDTQCQRKTGRHCCSCVEVHVAFPWCLKGMAARAECANCCSKVIGVKCNKISKISL